MFQSFELECHEHFQEIRRQIDMHREREEFNSIRDAIESKALKIVDQTKKFERIHFKSLNKILEKSLEHEISPIEKSPLSLE